MNPLLENHELPQFSEIKPADIEPAIDNVLEQNKKQIASLLSEQSVYSWQNLVHPIELMDDHLSRVWSPVSHLNSVMNNEEWRTAYSNCLPKLSEYSTELGQNKALYLAYRSIKDGPEYASFSVAQKKIIDNALRDFELSGVALPSDKKQRYMDISQQLSSLTNQFEENLMDATNDWTQLVVDEKELAGLPESSRDLLRQTAPALRSLWSLKTVLPLAMFTKAAATRLQTPLQYAHAGGRGGGNHIDRLRIGSLQTLHQLHGQIGFADRHRMQPNHALIFQLLRQLTIRPKPLREARAPIPTPDEFPAVKRRCQQK